MNVVLTAYFTGKNDPQRRRRQPKNSYAKMSRWYESVVRERMNGVIFYDQLSRRFIAKHTHSRVLFRPYRLKTGRSVNDERFKCWFEWLQDNPKVKNVFLTDLFDVDFLRDPFTLLSSDYDLYCCWGRTNIKSCSYTKARMRQAYSKVFYPGRRALNAGVVGGSRSNVMRLLSAMVQDFDTIRSTQNVNMGVLNRRAHDLFREDRIMVGPPLHSRFKGYEKDGDFCIRHK